jgi:ADP-heptose:LPS heptosyltransferase
MPGQKKRKKSIRYKLNPMPLEIKDKKILLIAEQGYGDTILAARFIPRIRALGVTHLAFECKPELQPIFSQLPIDEYFAPQQAEYEKSHFDYYCPLMSLMGVLAVDLTNIPLPVAISIPDAAREKFHFIKSQYAGKLKIGIVWSGSLTFKDNDKRACSLESFLQLTELPNIQLFSLQKGEREKDIDRLHANPLVINLGDKLATFGDTAAAVDAMDLIVMTDSSVAHLAGSLGKPIMNLQQYKPYWLYYPESETTPWYPSMRIIRQQNPGDWDGVFIQLKKRLANE